MSSIHLRAVLFAAVAMAGATGVAPVGADAQELGVAVGPGFGTHEDMETTFVVAAWLRSESRPVELRVGWAGGSDERIGRACTEVTDETCADEMIDVEASLSTARLGYVMDLHRGGAVLVQLVPAVGAGYAQTTRDGQESGKSITEFTAVFGLDVGLEGRGRLAASVPVLISVGVHAQGWINPFPVELEAFKPFEDPFGQVQLEIGLAWTP